MSHLLANALHITAYILVNFDKQIVGLVSLHLIFHTHILAKGVLFRFSNVRRDISPCDFVVRVESSFSSGK